MANRFGFSEEELKPIRDRDINCVYCDKPMIHPWISNNRCDSATVEHLREVGPFYKKDGLKIDGLVICCGSCNSSRGIFTLADWFKKEYCIKNNINKDTIANPIKKYLKKTND